jgi:hypothetical protein
MKSVCKSVIGIMLISLSTTFLYAQNVSLDFAKKIAQNQLISLKDPNLKSASLGVITFSNYYEVKENNEILYYILNISGDNGFVIVSADERAYPILAYSLNGNFDEKTQPPAFAEWMNNRKQEISYIIQNDVAPNSKIISAWNTISLNISSGDMTSVEPLIKTKWNQGQYYNALCPVDKDGPGGRALTGCVATSMAQLMKFWNYPKIGNGQYSYIHPKYGRIWANFGGTTYLWDQMLNQLVTSNIAVSTLMYHCGIAVNMDYGPDESGAFDPKDELVNYFNYSTESQLVQRNSYSDSEWTALLKKELDSSRPMYYKGQGPSGGHAFICDGYQGLDYFHFNWGWGGYADGYFYVDQLSPAGMTFNTSQAAIIHLYPNARPEALGSISGSNKVFQGQTSVNYYVVPVKTASTYIWTLPAGANYSSGSSPTDNSINVDFGFSAQSGNIKVKARNDGGDGLESSMGITVIPVNGLYPPSNLTATTGNKQIQLKWTAPASRTPSNYKIFQGLNENGPFSSLNIFPTNTETTISGLTNGIKYWYYVTAVYSDGESSASNKASATPMDPNICSQATILPYDNLTSMSVRINYNLPINALSATIEYRISSVSTWSSKTLLVNSSYIDLSPLTPSSLYYYRIRTVCSNGKSDVTLQNEFTLDIASCSAASSLTINNITTTGVRFNFNLPGDLSLASLEIRKENTTTWSAINIVNSNIVYKDLTGLIPSTKYYFRIRTVCTNGATNLTTEDSFTTGIQAICATATILIVSEISTNSCKIGYTLPLALNSASLEYRKSNITTWTSVNLDLSSSEIELDDLSPNSIYYLRIKTACANGAVNITPDINFTTNTISLCSAASNLSTSNVTQTVAKINYKLPSGLKSCTLEYKTSTTSVWTPVAVNITSTNTDLAGLIPATQYYYRIHTICLNDTYNNTPDNSFTTLASVYCDPASSISTSNISSSGAQINFTLPSAVRSATLEYRQSNTSAWTSKVISISASLYSLTGLISSTSYYYRIKTICNNGYSNYTSSYNFTTSILATCSSATVLPISNIKSTSARINYYLPKDVATAKLEYRNANTATWTQVVISTTGSYYDITGLTKYNTYYYRIKTVCLNALTNSTTDRNFTTNSTLGISLNAYNDEALTDTVINVNCYPNPATNTLYVSLAEYKSGKYTCVLTNLVGQVYYKREFTETGLIEIDVRNFARGIYILSTYHSIIAKTIKVILY